MLLVCRFAVADEHLDDFRRRLNRALRLLSAQPGCRHAAAGRSADRPDRWVLVATFTSVVGYRRALQPFEVREHVIPLLSEALTDDPGGYETLAEAVDGQLAEWESMLASDAGTVGLAQTYRPGSDHP